LKGDQDQPSLLCSRKGANIHKKRSQAVARIADRTASQQTIQQLRIVAKHLQLLSRYCALSVLGSRVSEYIRYRQTTDGEGRNTVAYIA